MSARCPKRLYSRSAVLPTAYCRRAGGTGFGAFHGTHAHVVARQYVAAEAFHIPVLPLAARHLGQARRLCGIPPHRLVGRKIDYVALHRHAIHHAYAIETRHLHGEGGVYERQAVVECYPHVARPSGEESEYSVVAQTVAPVVVPQAASALNVYRHHAALDGSGDKRSWREQDGAVDNRLAQQGVGIGVEFFRLRPFQYVQSVACRGGEHALFAVRMKPHHVVAAECFASGNGQQCAAGHAAESAVYHLCVDGAAYVEEPQGLFLLIIICAHARTVVAEVGRERLEPDVSQPVLHYVPHFVVVRLVVLRPQRVVAQRAYGVAPEVAEVGVAAGIYPLAVGKQCSHDAAAGQFGGVPGVAVVGEYAVVVAEVHGAAAVLGACPVLKPHAVVERGIVGYDGHECLRHGGVDAGNGEPKHGEYAEKRCHLVQ